VRHDAISAHRHQYVCHWPDWPSSAAAAHGRQHYCDAKPVRPVPDKYAFQATNERTNESTKDKQPVTFTPALEIKSSIYIVLVGACRAR